MRSRASILPLACWRSTERAEPALWACSRRSARSASFSCIGLVTGGKLVAVGSGREIDQTEVDVDVAACSGRTGRRDGGRPVEPAGATTTGPDAGEAVAVDPGGARRCRGDLAVRTEVGRVPLHRLP